MSVHPYRERCICFTEEGAEIWRSLHEQLESVRAAKEYEGQGQCDVAALARRNLRRSLVLLNLILSLPLAVPIALLLWLRLPDYGGLSIGAAAIIFGFCWYTILWGLAHLEAQRRHPPDWRMYEEEREKAHREVALLLRQHPRFLMDVRYEANDEDRRLLTDLKELLGIS